MADLVITNGDVAADLIVAAGHGTDVLSWRDVLHEGPIAAGPIEELTALRSAWLASRFRLDAAELADDFAERDEIMRRHADYERIELWFEHDLFDQLQLVQILAFLAGANRLAGVTLVQADTFLGAERADTILRFADRARPVTQGDLDLAASVWADLAAPTPQPIAACIDALDARLPFLKPAIVRFLEELPAPANGLSRTEHAALAGIAGGQPSPRTLFQQAIRSEEAAFMGDWSFFRLLDDLAVCKVPLIAGLAPPGTAEDRDRFEEAELELTMAGDDVLAGEADHVAMSGLDRWWGGTHLSGRTVWRFDRGARQLVAPGAEGG